MSQKKTPFFILRDWNAKGGIEDKPGVTGKFGLRVQNEAKVKRVLTKECTGPSKHPFPTT